MSNKNIHKWQIILVSEHLCGIQYEGSGAKGERPYLVLKPHISESRFIAVPLTTIKIGSNMHGNWVSHHYLTLSYIKVDHLVLFDKFRDLEYIIITSDFLPVKIRGEVKEVIKKIFTDI